MADVTAIPPPPDGFTDDVAVAPAPAALPAAIPPPPDGFTVDVGGGGGTDPNIGAVTPAKSIPADTSPVPVHARVLDPADTPDVGGTMFGAREMPTDYAQVYSPEQRAAADNGVSLETPLYNGSGAASFAYGPKQRLRAFVQANPDVQFRVGPQSGQPEYLNVDSNRWALVEPPFAKAPGSFAGGLVAEAPNLLVGFVPLGRAEEGVTATAKASGLQIAGLTAVTSFLGEVSRLGVGKYVYGVNSDVDDLEIAKEAGKTAAAAGLSGAALSGLNKFGGFMLDVMKGNPITPEMRAAAGLGLAEAQEVETRINDILKAERGLKIDSAQASNDIELLAMKRALARDPKYIRAFGLMDREQQDALVQFYKGLNAPYDSALNGVQTADRVRGAAQGTIDLVKEEFDRRISQGNAAMRKAVGELPASSYEDAGVAVRGIASDEQTALQDWSRNASANLSRVAGEKPFITNNATAELLNGMDEKIQQSLFPKTVAGEKAVMGPRVVSEKPVDQGIRLLRESLGADNPETEQILNAVFVPGSKMTFKQADQALSAINRMIRDKAQGVADPPDVGFLIQMATAIKKDINGSVDHAEMPFLFKNMWDDFRTTYAKEADRLFKGTVGKVLQREGTNGPYKVMDAEVFNKAIFAPGPRGGEQARAILALRPNDPEMMNQIREGVVDFMKTNVMRDGKFNETAYRNMLGKYGEAIREYFGMTETTGFSATSKMIRQYLTPGRLAKDLDFLNAEKGRVVDQLNKSFNGQLADLNSPDKVFNTIFNSAEPMNIAHVQELLRPFPEVWAGVQSAYRQRMWQGIVDRKGSTLGEDGTQAAFNINPTRLSNWLHGKADSEVAGTNKSQEEIIRTLFGNDHWDNLLTLEKATQIVARKGLATAAEPQGLLAGLARAAVGVLTPQGRALTAFQKMQTAKGQELAFRAISDPKVMKELIKLQDAPITGPQAAAFLGANGASILLHKDDGDLQPGDLRGGSGDDEIKGGAGDDRIGPGMTDQFNTKLSAADEQKFQDYLKKSGKQADLEDYDLRGAWKAGETSDARGHLTDKFKKPNHPTFSSDSQYSGKGEDSGGKWVSEPGGKWRFEAAPSNLKYRSQEDLQKYFSDREPGSTLVLPKGSRAERTVVPSKARQATVAEGLSQNEDFQNSLGGNPITRLGFDPKAISVATQADGFSDGRGGGMAGMHYPGEVEPATLRMLKEGEKAGRISGPGSSRTTDAIIAAGADYAEMEKTIRHESVHRGISLILGDERSKRPELDVSPKVKLKEEDLVRIMDYIFIPDEKDTVEKYFKKQGLVAKDLATDNTVLKFLMKYAQVAQEQLGDNKTLLNPKGEK